MMTIHPIHFLLSIAKKGTKWLYEEELGPPPMNLDELEWNKTDRQINNYTERQKDKKDKNAKGEKYRQVKLNKNEYIWNEMTK